MPAKHYIDHENKLIVTKWFGEATDSSLLNAFKKYQANIQSDARYFSYGEIVDFRDIPPFHISLKGLKDIGEIALLADEYRRNTRVAFIVSTNLAVNLVKLYALYRNFGQQHKKYIRAFKNESEAREWVRHYT